MVFDPAAHLIQLPKRVKDKATGQWTTVQEAYLEVRWRVLWFRQDHPHGLIISEEVRVDLDKGYARYRAVVVDSAGGQAIAHGTETAADFPDFAERAETRAIGRALALMGYGTAHVGEDLTEGDHPADAPVAQAEGSLPDSDPALAPLPPEEGEALPTAVPMVADLPARGRPIRDLKPALLAMLINKVEPLAGAQGGRWTALLQALQAERERRLAAGRRTGGAS